MANVNDATVIYNQKPADFSVNPWNDASVTGNGKVTAAVLGAYGNEEILLGRTDLKYGGYTGVLQDVSDKFPNVRKFFNEGKLFEAERLLSGELAKKGYNPRVERFLPLAVIGIDFVVDGFVSGYSRVTDMKSGEVEVSFKQGATLISRSLFAGRQNDTVAYKVEKNGHDKINARIFAKVPDGIVLQNETLKYEGGYTYFAARTDGGQDYGFVARVTAVSGAYMHPDGGILLKDCDGFQIFIKTFVDSSRDAEFKNLKAELSLIKSYDKLFSAHESAHRKMFDVCTLELGGVKEANADFASLISLAGNAVLDAGLIERLWNFGKYLAICGVQADDVSFNNSAQLLYSGIMPGVAPNAVLSFFEYYEKYVDDLKKNAMRVFGMRGYFVPSTVSPKCALFGAVDPATVHFIASGALAANIFYGYYLATGDIKTLKTRIFPFMREVLAFYSDFLKLDTNGFYTTVPSYSPMSTPGNVIAGKPLKNFSFATNSTVDFLALDSLLDNLISAAGVCGTNTAEIPAWQDMRTKIPPLGINDAGCLKEYTNSAFIDGAVNSGTMHAYGLWPLKNVSFNDAMVPYRPAVVQGSMAQNAAISLRRASFNAVVARLARSGGLQNARTLAVAVAQSAHAGLGDVSASYTKNILLKLLVSCFTQSGLCLSNDWRGSGYTHGGEAGADVCGNLGFATAVTECIVQSNQNNLRILPNLFEGLEVGRIVDAAADFGARVSVEWDTRKGRCVIKIMPKVSCKIDIFVCDKFKRTRSRDIAFRSDINGFKDVALAAGKTLTIEFI